MAAVGLAEHFLGCVSRHFDFLVQGCGDLQRVASGVGRDFLPIQSMTALA